MTTQFTLVFPCFLPDISIRIGASGGSSGLTSHDTELHLSSEPKSAEVK
jgi:hypothetical protein